MPKTTQFVESNALLALMSEDVEGARAILSDSLPGELRSLERASERLADLCRQALHTLDHNAGRHEGYARSAAIDSRGYGCPLCHKAANIAMPGERKR